MNTHTASSTETGMHPFACIRRLALAALLGIGASTAAAVTVTPGDIGYWRFEEGDATLSFNSTVTRGAIPASGNGSSFSSTVPYSGATNASMAKFTGGTTDAPAINVNNSTGINLDSFTFEAYVNQTSRYSTSSYLISKLVNTTGTADQRSWGIGIAGTTSINGTNGTISAGGVFVSLSSDGKTNTTSTYGIGLQLNLNVDYYIAVSFDNVNLRLTFYAQNLATGEVLSSVTSLDSSTVAPVTVASNYTSLYDSSAPISIGAYNLNKNRFDGYMDEVRLTNGVLDPSQYLISSPIPEPQHLALLFGAIATLFIIRKRFAKK